MIRRVCCIRIKIFTPILILLLISQPLFPTIGNFLDSIKSINVNSLNQKIIDKNKIIFEGSVEIIIDNKFHICADEVEVDKSKYFIKAYSNENSLVKLEDSGLLILSDYLEMDLINKSGYADDMRINAKEGFVSAKKAEKVDDKTWRLQGITYTACDRESPHWAFYASNAVLFRNSVLKATNLFLSIKDIPVFVFPALIFPLQSRSGSGFLIPKFSYDEEYGFGLKQEYYWHIKNHCDTTIGFNFFEKKGFLFSDEFRWAKSSENFLIMNSYYAEEWDAILEKRGMIVSATDKHYWIRGKYFQPISFSKINLNSLVQFDFGTDKRIGYYFLNDAGKVEDFFFNTATERYFDPKNIGQLSIKSERVVRRKFTELPKVGTSEIKIEDEEKYHVYVLPRLEWGTSYFRLLGNMFYRHDILLDQVFLDDKRGEKYFVDSSVSRILPSLYDFDIDTARLFYRGDCQLRFNWAKQNLKLSCEPNFQMRSNIRKDDDRRNSQHQFYPKYLIEWSLPRFYWDFPWSCGFYDLHPIINWSYVTKFYQNHWHKIDKIDRVYPENKFNVTLRNGLNFDSTGIDLILSQAFDFYNNNDLFFLRRGSSQNHILPFEANLKLYSDNLNFNFTQEYDWKNFSALQTKIDFSFNLNKYGFFIGYINQKEMLQQRRNLLSDIQSFAMFGLSVPIGKDLKIHYDGSFFTEEKDMFPRISNIKPLYHRTCLDYDGHCWGFSLGFEEKKYKQYGNWKNERAITFAIKLDSIGSFKQKFRRPLIKNAPDDYKA